MTRHQQHRRNPEFGAVLDSILRRQLSRRNVLRLGAACSVAAGATLLAGSAPIRGLRPKGAAAAPGPARRIWLGATDGFIYIPGEVPGVTAAAPYIPDPLSPMGDGSLPDGTKAPNMWGFGFRDLTPLLANAALSEAAKLGKVTNQRGQFQASAPQLVVDEDDDVYLNLRNLGLTIRPDLTDSHTIHWHGFRNAIPLFDGVPELSIAVPIGRDFTYFYRPRNSGAGTYMYHCHFEDVEHVSMGMTGIIFVRPRQNRAVDENGSPLTGIPVARLGGSGDPAAPMGYAYNDGVAPTDPHSTAYDREFGMFLSEAWAAEHFNGAHIQEHDWSEYHADIWLLNGRSYPDTLELPGEPTDATTGDLPEPTKRPELRYQPISSLVRANVGDRILLRFVNLGFQQHAMTIDGLRMRVVGKDATLLRGRDVPTWQDYVTNTIQIGPGESVDAIVDTTGAGAGTYLLYNRNLSYLHTPGSPGLGGQITEIRLQSSGLDPQTEANR